MTASRYYNNPLTHLAPYWEPGPPPPDMYPTPHTHEPHRYQRGYHHYQPYESPSVIPLEFDKLDAIITFWKFFKVEADKEGNVTFRHQSSSSFTFKANGDIAFHAARDWDVTYGRLHRTNTTEEQALVALRQLVINWLKIIGQRKMITENPELACAHPHC